ncbi:ATP-dependent DNA helicase PIF1 [Lucilia cuprina]|nr:ATP-dependent DNA helicase PIF1 [Lucilia cuprina]
MFRTCRGKYFEMPRTRNQSAEQRRVLHRNRMRQLRLVEESEDNTLHSVANRNRMRQLRLVEESEDNTLHSVANRSIQRRSQPVYNSIWRMNRRQDVFFRQTEQMRNNASRQLRRADLSYSQRELTRDEELEESRRIVAENRNRIRFLRYNDTIKQGPTIICTCCGGLWFPHQVEELSRDRIHVSNDFITDVFCLSERFPTENNKYNFCKTCCRSIKNKRRPNIRLSNGLDYPEIPECLKDLTSIEERLVTARLPFMIIIALGFERQSAIRGAVVNVPISVNEIVTALPRTFDQAEVIQLHLRRRLEYQHDYMTETIRPARVIEAARYLVRSDLYIKHGITIDSNWFPSFASQNVVPFVADRQDEIIINDIFNNQNNYNSSTENNINEFDIENLNPGGQETLLNNVPVENIPLQRLVMAPGEGQRPLDMIMDEDSEELAFVTIYGGKKRTCPETYSKIVRSELRRYDRRACRIDKLLYSYKKLELLSIKNATSIALRKHVRSNNVTAGNALNETFMNSLIQHDDGYRILKGVRSSPAHWEAEKKKAEAMIRQFILPTFFITLSAAETKWAELLVILSKTIDNVEITEDEAINLSFTEKARLIRSDSITCARYFDFRFRQLFGLFKMENGIFDNNYVQQYYWRVEFQHRGSPHIHGMYWLKDSPKIDLNDPSTFPAVIQFIDKYISTNSSDPCVAQYIDYQKHNHNRSCTREYRDERICRYGIPFPPMPQTEILTPLPDNFENLSLYKEGYIKIQSFLNRNLSAEEVSNLNDFEYFLGNENINMSYESYKLSLRSSLKKPKIFLRRKFQDKMLNAYNSTILKLHRANMDIQFILDAYACCSYIVNYINKSNRGVSRILRDAIDEIRGGNCTIKQKLQHIGHKFISGTEISAQEATYCCLGMRLSESSNADIYINTGRPEERVLVLRSRDQLQNLPSYSTDIYVASLLDHYVQRPDELDSLCLADFAAFYKFLRTARNIQNDETYNEHEDQEENELSGRFLRLKDNSGFIKKKTKPNVIRYRHYNVNTHRSDYFRELVMLYHPWRNEEIDILQNDNEGFCSIHKDSIESNRRRYDVFEERELENVLENLRHETESDSNGSEDNYNTAIDNEFRVLGVPEINPDINVLNIPENEPTEESSEGCIRLIKLPPLMPENDLLTMVRSLNNKQKLYLSHLLHNIKLGHPFYEFVASGAGVGKSRLISAIYQSVNYRQNYLPGNDPNVIKVLLCAPTGKAAFGIGGATLHSMFSLPINQSSAELRPLTNDTANTLYSKFLNLKLLIIDEISMVGSKMFRYLDARLKQVFKSTAPFGGISVVVFGDLRQLPPVGDSWIFSAPTNDPYSAIYGSSLWDMFKYFELNEIMRQREDQAFARALNNMACGKMSEADISLMKSREVLESHVPDEAIHLLSTNNEVDNWNTIKLNSIATEEITSYANDHVKSIKSIVGLSRENRDRILENVKSFKTSETQGLRYDLKLKTTAKYMITVNINTSDGLVNGATGQLMQIDFDNNRKPFTLWIKFPDASTGILARSQRRHQSEALWTPIELLVRSFQYKRNENVNIDRKQFPVVPAEGITIHKSQGATYSSVAVHLKSGMKRSALYVACSRATSASGLYLIGKFPTHLPNLTNKDLVQVEMNNLQNSKKLITNFDFLMDRSSINVTYHNVQSLHAHIEDVRCDNLILQSDILCFVETWTLSHENYDIPGFRILPRMRLNSNENANRRCKRGIIVYVKNELANFIQYCDSKQVHIANKTFEFIIFKYQDINITVLYRNKNYPALSVIRELNELFSQSNYFNDKSIIIGDFNICRRNSCSELERQLKDKGFYSLNSTSTTKSATQIDWSFSNIDESTISAKTYETLHSYHDAICVSILR